MEAEAAPFSFTAYRREDAAGLPLGLVRARTGSTTPRSSAATSSAA